MFNFEGSDISQQEISNRIFLISATDRFQRLFVRSEMIIHLSDLSNLLVS